MRVVTVGQLLDYLKECNPNAILQTSEWEYVPSDRPTEDLDDIINTLRSDGEEIVQSRYQYGQDDESALRGDRRKPL